MKKTYSFAVTLVIAVFLSKITFSIQSQPVSPSTDMHTIPSKVKVTDLVIREMLPGASSTAGYFTLVNHSDQAVALVAVSSEALGRIEIHEHSMVEGMMMMQKVTEQLIIEPHQSLVFAPGGYHLMLFKPKQKLSKGTSLMLNFKFADISDVNQVAKVVSVLDQQNNNSSNKHSHHH